MSAKRETREGFEELASYNLGETVVLLISTHGLIIKKEDEEEVDTFRVPPGITIKRAAVSVPGECNIVGADDIIGYEQTINSQMGNLLNRNEKTQKFAIGTVLGTIQREDMRDLPNKQARINIDRRLKEKGDDELFDESDDEHLQNYMGYVRHFDKAHRIKIFEEGERILNKKYTRTNLEATKSDWVIKVMSVRSRDKPDLLSFLKTQTRFGVSSIMLEDIVDFFAQKGVKNIIIFDLSCSNIARPEDHLEYDQRYTRRLRGDIERKGYGGKRKKRYNTKRTRTRKNRKTRKHYKK